MKERRSTPINIEKEVFRRMGYELVDRIASFLDSIEDKPVTTGESPARIQAILGNDNLPEQGIPADELLTKATELVMDHSLLNGHPKFYGYITSSPAPIGALADLLAASVNPNVGANVLSPMATAIEKQTIKWLAEFIGLSPSYGGVLVSGGNMANFTAFLAARTAIAPRNFKEGGLKQLPGEMVLYASRATHTWIEKAAVLFGHGTSAIRWIDADINNRMNTSQLKETIESDLMAGKTPFMVVGNAGDVSTGAVDDLSKIAAVCRSYNLWFHIDGAYGIPAAVIPSLKWMFAGLEEADSIALDPHKWLYAPLEVGCTLVKNPQHLIDTFSSHPVYYNFDTMAEEPSLNFYEYSLQNSRGFRALKVWLALQQVGRDGYREMISEDIELSKQLFIAAEKHPEMEAVTQNLSIATFRYIPSSFMQEDDSRDKYLNELNEKLLNALQQGGEVFLSNAMVAGKYCLRACIVNFRTSKKDILETIDIIVREGRKMHQQLENRNHPIGVLPLNKI